MRSITTGRGSPYGPLAEALLLAAEQPAEIQNGLWIATHDDVVAHLDMIEG
jgi:hypothetical protein